METHLDQFADTGFIFVGHFEEIEDEIFRRGIAELVRVIQPFDRLRHDLSHRRLPIEDLANRIH